MIEMVAMRDAEEPDWRAAEEFIDALILEEVDDELVETCGVDPDSDPRQTWLPKIKDRLRSDLECFRDDALTDRDEIEQWETEDLRIFVSVGDWAAEKDANTGHGWMCRLVDSGALGTAGFIRIRKAEL